MYIYRNRKPKTHVRRRRSRRRRRHSEYVR